jgi:hypothetical protein
MAQKANVYLIQEVITANGDTRRLPTRPFRSRNVAKSWFQRTERLERTVVSTSQEILFRSAIPLVRPSSDKSRGPRVV